ncbi:MAG: molybdenum cofactor guanylyltransferase [Polyangiales bacterium]
MTAASVPSLLAIFVGGKSLRMGEPKGLLAVPDSAEPILEALVQRGRQAGFDPILVGDALPYAHLAQDVPRVPDNPQAAGPLGGLQAALQQAARTGFSHVIVIACDMPYVTPEALGEVLAHRSTAMVVAPRRGPAGPWEPMLARYDVARLAPVLSRAISRGQRSFQKLFATIEVEALPMTPVIERALHDWDSPEDLGR